MKVMLLEDENIRTVYQEEIWILVIRGAKVNRHGKVHENGSVVSQL